MKVLAIIPAYNEAKNIESVINNIKSKAPFVDYIVINDCSTDNTKAILESIKANHVNLPVNLGIGGGIQTGYKYAFESGYDIAIQIDGDGQHNPTFLNILIAPIKEGLADIVIGSRYLTNEGFQSSEARRLGIKFLSNLIKLCCGTRIRDVTSGYRAVNRKYMELYSREYAQDYPEPEAIIIATLSGARIIEVPVIMHERNQGVSSISKVRAIYYMLKVSISIILSRFTFNKRGRK